jgi:hypothetical protein
MFDRIKKSFKRAKKVNNARKKVQEARKTVKKYTPSISTREIVGITCILLAIYVAKGS